MKKLRVYHNTTPIFDIKLADSMKEQDVVSKDYWLEMGDYLKVEILEIYPGEKYRDTAITELLPMGAH